MGRCDRCGDRRSELIVTPDEQTVCGGCREEQRVQEQIGGQYSGLYIMDADVLEEQVVD